MQSYTVQTDDPRVYGRPKSEPSEDRMYAEYEWSRYFYGDSRIKLPAGPYRAYLNLTEESFHAAGRDLGYWATVFSVPIEFEIAR